MFFYVVAFSFWLIPFLWRFLLIETPEVPQDGIVDNSKSMISTILESAQRGDKYNTFILLFKNNMRGCLLNIMGGFLLGVGTFVNLAINGFFSADVFASSYSVGISVSEILSVTLPHSFELLGFWLSGATGLNIAWNIILFIYGKESFSNSFYKRIGLEILIVFVVILVAAFVESYVSISNII